jgi:type IV pilus assembly protein PilY1
MNSQMQRAAWLGVGLLWATLSGAPAVADDSELFIGTSTAAGAQPNILLVIDNSISMRDDVRTQGDFVHDPLNLYPAGTSGCRADRVYYVIGSAPQPACNTSQWFYLSALKCDAALQKFVTVGYYTDYVAQYDDSSDRRWEALSTSSTRRDNAVECQDDAGVHGDGINTTNLYARNGSTSNGYWGTATSTGRLATNAWGSSPLDTRTVTMYSGNYMNYTYGPTFLRPKIDVAKEVASDLLDSVNGVNIGLMTFNPTGSDGSEGGYVVHKVEDIDAARTALQTAIGTLSADAATPLSETLYEAALYMSGGTWDYGNSRSVPESRLTTPSSQYDSPIEFACQKNFVVVLTDGEPRWDDSADTKIREMADAQGTRFSSLVGSTCDAETYPSNLNPSGGECLDDLAEFLYEGDFSTEPGQQNITTYTVGFDIDLAALADTARRGGGTYYTAADTATLSTSLQQIVTSILAANTTFTAPTVAVNAFNRTQNLSDLFISVFRPTSRMHWPGNLKRFRLDATTLDIVDANGRPAIDPATGFFADTAQDLWSSTADGEDVEKGGAANVLPAPSSRVVYTYQAPNKDLTHDDNRVRISNTQIDDTDLGIQTGGPTRDEVIDFITGVDLPDTDQDNNKTEARNQLGDPLHSQPVSMVYGPGLREGLIFSATNDGVLHAFDLDTGREHWSFVPPDFLRDQAALYENDAIAMKHYGIDGDMALQVVADSDTEIEAGEKVYLFFGMRRGGDFYYGIDVSDRDAPQLLWRIDGSTLTGIGQSWSTPVPTKVNVGGVEKLALVIGGGYEPAQDNPTARTDTVGNSIYIVDSETGALIWRGSKTGATANFAKMDYSIPSDVRVIDLDGNGLADRLYVGDMGGQVWRFDIHNTQPAASLVTGGVIAQLGAAPNPTTATLAETRRFYYPPSVAPVNRRGYDFISIAIGSGSRGNPLGTQVQDRFYALRDFNFGQMDQAEFDALTVIDNSMLEPINTVNESIPQTGTMKGWYLNLGTGNGEKVLAEARTFDNEVIFTTFRPGSSGAGCVPQLGTNRVYRMAVFNGSPVLNLDGSADPTTLTMSDLYVENEGSPLPAPQVIFLPPDRDGDGVPDTEDDTDGDGIADVDDTDYDGDGILDTMRDTDNDGIVDSEDDDLDGDDIPNADDPDADGDGRNDLQYQDLNMNGVPDFFEGLGQGSGSGRIVTIIGLMRFPEGYRNDPVRTYWRQGNIGN